MLFCFVECVKKDQDRIADFDMKLTSIESEQFRILEDKDEYQAIVRMPSAEFARICNDLSSIVDTVTISVIDQIVQFSSKSDSGTANIVCRQNATVDKPEEAIIIKIRKPVLPEPTFTLRYMNSFTKATPLSNTVTISLSSELPVVVEYKIAGMGYIRNTNFHGFNYEQTTLNLNSSVGACVVTFTVGGLSVLNAIAGSYSENLPVICIVGGPKLLIVMIMILVGFFIILLVYLILLGSFGAFSRSLVLSKKLPSSFITVRQNSDEYWHTKDVAFGFGYNSTVNDYIVVTVEYHETDLARYPAADVYSLARD
ncbi:hypothetical protein IFM89_029536 [Coptis chinensis]|uniref:Proliferating cell nuclear antigen PCNA C-terminal domain-containing protein n=1 Tax=Coptis chinensis TaxID=261450 RepID=A0A835H0J9_9MAGN|nr:hypothetical protein IFM89_029536 [Coptis chinensis]